MFTFLDTNISISEVAMFYPIQVLLIGGLIVLGLYELFQLIDFRKNFTQKRF